MSTSHLGELAGLSTAELKLLFLRAQSDIQLLRQLNEELKTRDSDEDTDLQIDVVVRLRNLQRENTGIGLTVGPARHILGDPCSNLAGRVLPEFAASKGRMPGRFSVTG